MTSRSFNASWSKCTSTSPAISFSTIRIHLCKLYIAKRKSVLQNTDKHSDPGGYPRNVPGIEAIAYSAITNSAHHRLPIPSLAPSVYSLVLAKPAVDPPSPVPVPTLATCTNGTLLMLALDVEVCCVWRVNGK